MLTFLRKIRRSLIESGSARKYILYAIGEIALVVIGILVALQINNWNENRITGNIELEYLRSLDQEIESDIINIKNISDRIEKRSEIPLRSALRSINSGVIQSNDTTIYSQADLIPLFIENDTLRFFNEILQINRNQYFQPNRITFEDLISSGRLSVIKNKKLRNKLREYYERIDLKNLYSIDNARSEMYYAKTRSLRLSFYEINFLDNMNLETPERYLVEMDLKFNSVKNDDELLELIFNRLMWNDFEISQNQEILKIADELKLLIQDEIDLK